MASAAGASLVVVLLGVSLVASKLGGEHAAMVFAGGGGVDNDGGTSSGCHRNMCG